MSLRHEDGRAEVTILGAGIIGLSLARELARRGVSVEVLAAERAGAATPAAAGMLAPLAELPPPGPMLNACLESRDLWPDLVAELESESGIDLDYDRSGAIICAPPPEEERAGFLQRLQRAAVACGEPALELGGSELRELVPDLDPSIPSALHLPGDHRVDNRQVWRAMQVALGKLGVPVHGDHLVRGIYRDGEGLRIEGEGWRRRTRRVVIAAGAWSHRIEGLPPVPLRPIRGQMLSLDGVQWPHLGTLRHGSFYAVRRSGHRLLLGATMEEVGFASHPTPGGVAQLLQRCQHLLPGLQQHALSAVWAGLRPASADGLPLLGPLDDGRLWLATGHLRNGILLAPWTARVLAESIVTGVAAVPETFLPTRAPETAPLPESCQVGSC